jgi:hypothetical protein
MQKEERRIMNGGAKRPNFSRDSLPGCLGCGCEPEREFGAVCRSNLRVEAGFRDNPIFIISSWLPFFPDFGC